MKTITSPEDFLSRILPEGETLFQNIETLKGDHVSKLVLMLMNQIEVDLATNATQMDIYSNIVALSSSELMDEKLQNDITDKILKLAANLAVDPKTQSAFVQRVKGQFPHIARAVQEHPEALYVSWQEILADRPLPDDFTLEELENYENSPETLAKFHSLLQSLADSDDEEILSILPPELKQKTLKGEAPTREAFTDKDDALREALSSIFDSIGSLKGSPFSQHTIREKMEIALRRCISHSYDYTENSVELIDRYLEIVSEFRDDENEYKRDLFDSIQRMVVYVKNHSLDSLGLNPQYNQLRLSQIIPNYFLKQKGYVLDASACSSGKTGTILLAPVETGSKVTIVLVENNTYQDIYDQFVTWYKTRTDFKIYGKKDFWGERWIKDERNVIMILSKSFLATTNDTKRKQINAETFESVIKRSGLELLIADEIHNYKGSSQGGTHKTIRSEKNADEDESETDASHNNCSFCTAVMARQAKFRLFASATPLLNDFTEIAKIMQMLLPWKASDPNTAYQLKLQNIQDSSRCTEDILHKTCLIYSPLQMTATRVPVERDEFTINRIDNPSSTYDSYTTAIHSVKEEIEREHFEQKGTKKSWDDFEIESLFFPFYIQMMEKEIVSALKAGKQICFYTNQCRQPHDALKNQILEIAENNGIQLDDDEVVLANGGTSSELRCSRNVTVDGGEVVEKHLLAEKVWNRSCKVLLANNVISVGLDGLQGTDRIENCGRISEVFVLANAFTDAIQYQFRKRFVRTQGGNSTECPPVTFHHPYLWFYTDKENNQNLYSRMDYTDDRLTLKRLKSDLVVDGRFPESISLETMSKKLMDMCFSQAAQGTFESEDAQIEREKLIEEQLDEMQEAV